MSLNTFLFPGQGSQKRGMTRAFDKNKAEVKEIFDMASDLSGRDILKLCTTGDDEMLGQTINTQIAVTTMNLSFLKLLENRSIQPDIVLGQSLGQFAAMVAAKAMSYEDTLRLVLKRAELMSSVTRPGVLCSVLGLTPDQVREVLKEIPDTLGTIEIALINSRTQVVLGGDAEAVDFAAEKMLRLGAFKTVKVKVSAAFHTSFMKEIEDELAEFIDTLPMKEPCCRMILNCKGDFAASAEEIRNDLKLATCHPVLWGQGLERLLENDDLLICEAGIGKAMAGMVRNMGYKGKIYLLSEARDFHDYTVKAKRG